MSTLLFIIDMQNDFCRPSGSLYIPNAEHDVQRLCGLIAAKGSSIHAMVLTQDNHQVVNIAHACFWRNANGEQPALFTNITHSDVEGGKWTPIHNKAEVLSYLRQLEEQGEYAHTIWPEHCIAGSEGAAIVPQLMHEVMSWAREQGKLYTIVHKGTYPYAEHFGAFRANVQHPQQHDTQLNRQLLEQLANHTHIWLAGEARSHCVANTIKQLFEFPELVKKLVIVDDTMSDVAGFEGIGLSAISKAMEMGATVTTSNLL